LVAVALLVPPVLRSVRNEAGRTTPALANETSGPSKVSEPTASNSLASREPDTIEIAGQTIPLRSLRVTVLDAQSDGPIPGAEGTHTLMGFSGEDAALAPSARIPTVSWPSAFQNECPAASEWTTSKCRRARKATLRAPSTGYPRQATSS